MRGPPISYNYGTERDEFCFLHRQLNANSEEERGDEEGEKRKASTRRMHEKSHLCL